MSFQPPADDGRQGSSSSNQNHEMMPPIREDPLMVDLNMSLQGLVMAREEQQSTTNPRTGKKYPNLSQAGAGNGPPPPADTDIPPFMLPRPLHGKEVGKFESYLEGVNTFSSCQEFSADPLLALPSNTNMHNTPVNRSAGMVSSSNLQNMYSFRKLPLPQYPKPYPGAFVPVHGNSGFLPLRHASGPQLGASSTAQIYSGDQRAVSLPTHLEQGRIYQAMGERALEVVDDTYASNVAGGRPTESLSSQVNTNVGLGIDHARAGVNDNFGDAQLPTENFPSYFHQYSTQPNRYRTMYDRNPSPTDIGGPSENGAPRRQPPIIPNNPPHLRVSSHPLGFRDLSIATPSIAHPRSVSYPVAGYPVFGDAVPITTMPPTQVLAPSTKMVAIRNQQRTLRAQQAGGSSTGSSPIVPNQPYQGGHPSHTNNRHHYDDLPDIINCALWVYNIPVSATTHDIFNTINVGAVASLHINPPDANHANKAAKLVFKEPSAAARYLNLVRYYGISIHGRMINARPNRHGHLRWAGVQTRVLEVTGPDHLMTWGYWNWVFTQVCDFQYDVCRVLPCGEAGRSTLQFHFERIDGQAQMCLKAVFMHPNHSEVKAGYGRDRCDPQLD
jgi:hypothetical protein